MIHSPYPDIPIPDVSLSRYVLQHAARLGNKPAITCGATHRTYTYSELSDAVQRVAAGLHARGIGKGDVVGIVSWNSPEFAILFLAAAHLGSICTAASPLCTAAEIGAQFGDANAALIVAAPDVVAKCREASCIATSVREIIAFGESPDAEGFESQLSSGSAPRVHIDPAVDVVALPYSSGTSGAPKGVMLTHRNIVANLCQVSASGGMMRESDVVLGVLPFFHIFGMARVMCGSLVAGATLVTLPRFELAHFISAVAKHRITFANVVPPILLALSRAQHFGEHDFSSLQTLLSGAAPLTEQLAAECEERLGVKVRQGYGLTEASPVTHIHPRESALGHTSIGFPIANTACRIVDPDTGMDLPRGVPGELLVRGPQVMRGYLNDPEATASCVDAEGWLHTGDIAVADETGAFTIVDRLKELIKYKGLQVAPAELEAVLLTNPGVADAAVIPVPDADAGEIPKAFVVLRSDLTEDDVISYVAARVSPYKKVRRVEFTDSIPRSVSGKILRRLLVERERERSASGPR